MFPKTHAGWRGERWQRLNVFVRSRGRRKEREQRSRNKRTLASISWDVERDGRARKHSFSPHPHRPHPFSPLPSISPPLSPFCRSGGWKGRPPPSGSTSPSKVVPAQSDRCLIVRDTGQLLFSFKPKTDCLSLGRGLLDKRHDKARTVQPSRGWRAEGVHFWKVCVCIAFLAFSFTHVYVKRRLCLFLFVLRWSTCGNASDCGNITDVFCPLEIFFFFFFWPCGHSFTPPSLSFYPLHYLIPLLLPPLDPFSYLSPCSAEWTKIVQDITNIFWSCSNFPFLNCKWVIIHLQQYRLYSYFNWLGFVLCCCID